MDPDRRSNSSFAGCAQSLTQRFGVECLHVSFRAVMEREGAGVFAGLFWNNVVTLRI